MMDVKCYGFSIAEPPFTEYMEELLDTLKACDSFLGVHCEEPFGLTVIFTDKKAARLAYRHCDRKGFVLPREVEECFVDEKYIEK